MKDKIHDTAACSLQGVQQLSEAQCAGPISLPGVRNLSLAGDASYDSGMLTRLMCLLAAQAQPVMHVLAAVTVEMPQDAYP